MSQQELEAAFKQQQQQEAEEAAAGGSGAPGPDRVQGLGFHQG